MRKNYKQKYIKKRFNAYKNILKIFALLGYVEPNPAQNIEEFEKRAGVKEIQRQSNGKIFMKFENDKNYKMNKIDEDNFIYYRFIEPKMVKTEFNLIQKIAEEFPNVYLNVIFVSNSPVTEKGRQLIESNNISKPNYNVRYFSVSELQRDVLDYVDQPISIREATKSEVDNFFKRQIGFRTSAGIIKEDYYEKLKRFPNGVDKENFKKEIRDEILSYLPTVVDTDPYIKWHGFKAGSIIIVETYEGISMEKIVLDGSFESKKKQERSIITFSN